MNDWQSLIVALLLFFCFVRICLSIYSFFKKNKAGNNPCENCTSACDLKILLDKKRKECAQQQKKDGKSCCG